MGDLSTTTSSYPGSLDTWTNQVDSPAGGKTLVAAAHPNGLADAIINMQTILGTDPEGGTLTDVKTFLQVEHTAATGAHDATKVMMLAGAQTVTGVKTLGANLLFTDATYDIGASGATRPRDLFLSRNATVGGTLGVTGVLTATAGIDAGGNGAGSTLKTKVINIGDWDMNIGGNGVANVNVVHGVTYANIRRITALIRNDTDASIYDFASVQTAAATYSIRGNSTIIELTIQTGGFFDGTAFDTETSYNRGWIVVDYV